MTAKSLKDGEVEELKSKADILNIISSYVNLKKAGKNHTGLCPFHKEKTPSFTVDATKQLYHCFGCGEGGDIIRFIEKIENIEFVEAVEFLAKKVGYTLKFSQSDRGLDSKKAKNRIIEVNELAKKYYSYILFKSKNGSIPLGYLKQRGFNENTIMEFSLGYSMDKWDNFSNFAVKRGFRQKEVIESGLAIESRKPDGKIYDRFRGRIMFPIEDIIGQTIGFGGRVISKSLKTVQQYAKYINTPETKLFSKSKNIYWLSRAKNHIVSQDQVLIMEGYTDVMALFQQGIKNAVASLGTALTSEQVKLLGRFTRNMILVFDNDQAGISASLKGMEKLKEYNERLDLYYENNINMRVAILEEGYDPAEYIFKYGKDKFLEKINYSASIIDFTLNSLISKYDINNLSGKLEASSAITSFISTLSSRIVQEECIKKVSQKLKLKESLLLEEMLKRDNRQNFQKNDTEKKDGPGPEEIPPLKRIEIEALKIIINGIGDRINEFTDLAPEYFRFDDTRELFIMLKEKIREESSGNRKLNFPIKITSGALENESIKKLYNYILFSELHYDEENKNLAGREILFNLKKIFLSDEIEGIRKKMIEIEDNKGIETGDESNGTASGKYDDLYEQLIKLELSLKTKKLD